MKFFSPIPNFQLGRFPKGDIIQYWGENSGLYQSIGLPFHNGWDIIPNDRPPYGSEILAAHDAVVVEVDFQGTGYGHFISLLSEEIDGIYFMTRYGHLASTLVRVGDTVLAGQKIATMGNSGFVVSGGVSYWGGSNPDKRGTHLHFGVKQYRRDPGGYNILLGVPYRLLNQNNGVQGWINPAPLFGEQIMSNVVPVHRKGTPEYGFYVPATSEEALKDKAKNFGVDIEQPNGTVDYTLFRETEF